MQRSLSEASQFVIDSVYSLGLNVPCGSRFMKMHRVLHNSDGTCRDYIDPDDADFEIALEALRDMRQLEFFFDQFNLDSESNGLKSHVKMLLNDCVLPQDDQADTSGRDAQAELFVFAGCRKASFNPSFKEPDVVCSLDGQEVLIAVKRIKNMRQLVKRIRIGASQIVKAGGYGIVVVDVMIAMNPKNYRIIAKVSNELFGMTWGCILKKVVNKYYAKIQQTIQNKGVLAVILHDHWIRMDYNSNWRLETMTYRIRARKINVSFESLLDTFSEKYRCAFPNPTILTK